MNHLETLQTGLLLGTDRAPLTDALQEHLQQLGLTVDDLPEKTAAEVLVFYRQWQRAGFPISSWTGQVPQIQLLQTEPECSTGAARCLQDILDGKYPDALAEWVKLLFEAGQVLPPQALPALLQRCVEDSSLWDTLQPAIGARGQWLLLQHSEWRHLSESDVDPKAWGTISGPARLELLRGIRKQNPTLGRSLLQSTWLEEDPAQKAQLLNGLSIGLSLEDETFLEACLQERRKETRQLAAELLASIPGSALVSRYLHYLRNCIAVDDQKIILSLPLEAPYEWRRDGIEISGKSPFTLMQRSAWLFQLIRRLPPSYWQTYWGLSPQTTIALFAQQDREESWVQALTDACLLHNDTGWQEALADWWLKNKNSSSWKTTPGRHLLQQLPEVTFQKMLTPYLQNQQYLLEEDHAATFLLCANQAPWNDALTLALVQPFRRYLEGTENPFWNIWHYSRLLKATAYHCDPGLFAQLNSQWNSESALWLRWQAEVERMLTVVQFRGKMFKTFSHIG